jgi:hypothetical protein
MEDHNETPQPVPPIPRPRRPTRTAPVPPQNEFSTQHDSQPLVSSPVAENVPTDLTPLRAHYLKKSLIQLQFNHELDAITTPASTNISSLSYLGPPFAPPPKDAPLLDLPFLRYMFRQFILTFPFMAAAPKDFYSEKLQPFMASVLARNISPTSVFDDGSEGSEQALRLRLLAKAERNLSLFIGAATKIAEQEEVVRLTQVDLDRLESAAKKRQAKNLEAVKDIFEVNIVSVRTVVDKGRVRSRVHEVRPLHYVYFQRSKPKYQEFIVRTRRSNFPDVFVSRRYGDFRALALEVRGAFSSVSNAGFLTRGLAPKGSPHRRCPTSACKGSNHRHCAADGIAAQPSTDICLASTSHVGRPRSDSPNTADISTGPGEESINASRISA